MNISVVLVEPENEGNVGSIARLMKNFGLAQLWLINPKCNLGSEAYARAVHAGEILENAHIVDNIKEALQEVRWIAGTTSIVAKKTSNLRRIAITPEEFAVQSLKTTGSMALLFGREGSGLSNCELDQCDIVVSVPSSPSYRTLNVASTSAIIFYELWKMRMNNVDQGYIDEVDVETKERLLKMFDILVIKERLPEHKRILTNKAFKNIISRAFISKREAFLITGVLRRAVETNN